MGEWWPFAAHGATEDWVTGVAADLDRELDVDVTAASAIAGKGATSDGEGASVEAVFFRWSVLQNGQATNELPATKGIIAG